MRNSPSTKKFLSPHFLQLRRERLHQLANTLSIVRLSSGLPIIVALCTDKIHIAWWLFLCCAITDFLDGYLARKAGGGTPLGAKLDPMADKVLTSAPLIWLVSTGALQSWAVWLLISRELIVSSWRSSQAKGGPASLGGKAKTILQLLSLLLMLWPPNWGGADWFISPQFLGYFLFWPSLFLALVSGMNYLCFPIRVSSLDISDSGVGDKR